jgi:hypothetical protein
MHPEEAEEHLAVIRGTMERATRYTGLPATACFIAGALGIAGAIWCRVRGIDFDVTTHSGTVRLVQVWGWVCLTAMGQFAVLTALASRRRGEPAWSRLTQRVAVAVAPGLVVAALLSYHHADAGRVSELPPLWCLCYGASVLGLGLYAGWKANLVGSLFLVGGTLGLFWLRRHGVELMAASFGGLHLLLGVLIRMDHDRGSTVRES